MALKTPFDTPVEAVCIDSEHRQGWQVEDRNIKILIPQLTKDGAVFLATAINSYAALVEALEYAQDRLDFADAQHMEVLHARIAEALRLAKGES